MLLIPATGMGWLIDCRAVAETMGGGGREVGCGCGGGDGVGSGGGDS